jgi:hypothetical protein
MSTSKIAVIVVTEYNSMRGQYKLTIRVGAKTMYEDIMAWGGEAAAAAALDKAFKWGDHGYSIFAPKDVLKLIPEDLRNSRK